MKRYTSCLWLTCVLTVASAQQNPNRITPGKKLGKLNVGDLMEDMKWLKKPDYGDAVAGHRWQTWEAKKRDPRNGNITNSLDVYTSPNVDGKNQIRIIRSTSPTFSTKDGVKVRSTLAKAKDLYPKLVLAGEYESPQFASKVALYDDTLDGISFEFKVGKDGQVGLHEKCLSIWVHEPAVAVMASDPITYLTAKPSYRKAKRH